MESDSCLEDCTKKKRECAPGMVWYGIQITDKCELYPVQHDHMRYRNIFIAALFCDP